MPSKKKGTGVIWIRAEKDNWDLSVWYFISGSEPQWDKKNQCWVAKDDSWSDGLCSKWVRKILGPLEIEDNQLLELNLRTDKHIVWEPDEEA